MKVNEKIHQLRELMQEKGIDAYIIPSFDAHQSEYVPDYWKSRAWISGFTGSAGTVVVTMNESGLWTDGRYFIQAEKQLLGSEIKLFKMRQPGVPTFEEWLSEVLPQNSCVGFDGKVFSCKQVKELESKLSKKKIKLNDQYDFIGEIWKDRPELPLDKIFIHELKYTGLSAAEKIEEIRKEMRNKGADYYIISSLDDIAWTYNIRGNDVQNNPVVISYSLISLDKSWLFIDKRKVDEGTEKILNINGVEVLEYNEIEAVLGSLDDTAKVYYDPSKVSKWLNGCLPKGCEKIEGKDIAMLRKALKNKVEIENLKRCQVRDGVAMARFIYWLKCNIGKEEITEISASEKLEDFRRQGEAFIGPSFDTIAGYKDHAAMMHYKATEEGQYTLLPEKMLLVDSGGQYLDGTTDITRTIVLGNITEEERKDFTLVLKGHIALCQAKFLHGVTGTNLDVLARLPLWEQGIDYKCGTGHGVGYLLGVHEAPQRFAVEYNDAKLEEGMVITNEPGVYKEGKYGIRTENTLLVVKDEETDSGQFMRFEVISYCPIDLEAIDVDMLTDKEKAWLNNYHENVYELLSPYLNEEEKEWLRKVTRAI